VLGDDFYLHGRLHAGQLRGVDLIAQVRECGKEVAEAAGPALERLDLVLDVFGIVAEASGDL
jgi:hypothetical protein